MSSLKRRLAAGTGLFWVIVVVSILVSGFFVMQALTPQEPVSSSVAFYDADGNPVPVSAAIMAGGMEVVSMEVKTSWVVDFQNIDPTTFNVHVTVRVYIDTAAGWSQIGVGEIDSTHALSANDPNANWAGFVPVQLWTLSDMLAGYMTDDDKASGWSLKVTATIAPTAKDMSGNPTFPDPATQDAGIVLIDLAWVSTTGTMTIITFEQGKWLALP